MPTGYVKKQAKAHHTSVGKQEGLWDRAKKLASDEGKKDDYAYITGIYKRLASGSGSKKESIDSIGEDAVILDDTLKCLDDGEVIPAKHNEALFERRLAKCLEYGMTLPEAKAFIKNYANIVE